VDRFARDLATHRIHVVLDQWDLEPGQDKYKFMEQCVTDPEVNRVLILLDTRYAERADRREGGVGTEALIMSPELYGRAEQTKFVPVVMERGENGEIPLPAYLKGRIYIDERLVRLIHGRPERTRPELGTRPSYLDDDAVQLTTGRTLSMFRRALLEDKRNQAGYLNAYLERLTAAYSSAAIEVPGAVEELEVLVSESIDRWLPYRDEFIELMKLLAQYGERQELYERLHAFFETLINLRTCRPTKGWRIEVETENLGFIGWELFLHAVAVLLRTGRYAAVLRLLEPYQVRNQFGQLEMRSYTMLNPAFLLIQETRQKRLGTRWLAAAAALLKERLTDAVPWDDIAGADTLLWARSELIPATGTWVPWSAAYFEQRGLDQLSLWVRVHGDDAMFGRVAPLLGVRDRDDARARLQTGPDAPLMSVGFTNLYPRTLARIMGVQLP
jgi:hypothetical protein